MKPPAEGRPPARRATSTGRATMQEVAAFAGVSLKSVSRVVNGEAGVSEALAERVNHAVQELGYRHNLAASNLRRTGQRTASIGMLVQDLSNGFCSETLRAVEDRARERGVVVMASSTDEDGVRERELVRGLVSRRIDGLILMPTGPDLSWLEVDLASGLAVVTVDRRPVRPELDGVMVDNRGAAMEAVSHLVAHGHRRIAFLGDATTILTAVDRRDGYRAALRAAGVTPDQALERVGLRSRDDSRSATTELLALEDPPTAIFAARNVICEGALMSLQQHHLSSCVALIGFDEVSVAELVHPAISVVRQDTYEIGTRAIDLLLARLDGDDSPVRVEVVPSTLVARGSGELPFTGTVTPSS
ncbi:MAG: LacI family DNA-binding transcriptional regulator [Marmoricola sp.]